MRLHVYACRFVWVEQTERERKNISGQYVKSSHLRILKHLCMIVTVREYGGKFLRPIGKGARFSRGLVLTTEKNYSKNYSETWFQSRLTVQWGTNIPTDDKWKDYFFKSLWFQKICRFLLKHENYQEGYFSHCLCLGFYISFSFPFSLTPSNYVLRENEICYQVGGNKCSYLLLTAENFLGIFQIGSLLVKRAQISIRSLCVCFVSSYVEWMYFMLL